MHFSLFGQWNAIIYEEHCPSRRITPIGVKCILFIFVNEMSAWLAR